MDFPDLEPLQSLHDRVLSFVGGELLAAVVDTRCPRCVELESSSAWRSSTPHLHGARDSSSALLSAYLRANTAERRVWAARRRESDVLSAELRRVQGESERPAVVSSLRVWIDPQHWATAVGGPSDPLGPLGVSLVDFRSSPLARWHAAQLAAATAGQQRKQSSSSSESKRLRAAVSAAARARDELDDDVRAWHESAADAWSLWQLDSELASSFVSPNPSQEAGLSWH
jgi:hypothetical protein